VKKIQILISLALLIANAGMLNSCSKEEGPMRLGELNDPAFNGYYLRDESGFTAGAVGSPNVYLGDGQDYPSSSVYLICYPNPVFGSLIRLQIKRPYSEENWKLWITQATPSEIQETSSLYLGQLNLIAGGQTVFQAEGNVSSFVIDATYLSPGYYKIYLKTGDFLLHDNLVIL